jgi:hypothetical protein
MLRHRPIAFIVLPREAGGSVGVPAVCQGSIAADAGSGGQGRPAGPVGIARSGTLPALGLAAGDLHDRLGPGWPGAGGSDRRPDPSGQR